jgi:hypothetical protein
MQTNKHAKSIQTHKYTHTHTHTHLFVLIAVNVAQRERAHVITGDLCVSVRLWERTSHFSHHWYDCNHDRVAVYEPSRRHPVRSRRDPGSSTCRRQTRAGWPAYPRGPHTSQTHRRAAAVMSGSDPEGDVQARHCGRRENSKAGMQRSHALDNLQCDIVLCFHIEHQPDGGKVAVAECKGKLGVTSLKKTSLFVATSYASRSVGEPTSSRSVSEVSSSRPALRALTCESGQGDGSKPALWTNKIGWCEGHGRNTHSQTQTHRHR